MELVGVVLQRLPATESSRLQPRAERLASHPAELYGVQLCIHGRLVWSNKMSLSADGSVLPLIQASDMHVKRHYHALDQDHDQNDPDAHDKVEAHADAAGGSPFTRIWLFPILAALVYLADSIILYTGAMRAFSGLATSMTIVFFYFQYEHSFEEWWQLLLYHGSLLLLVGAANVIHTVVAWSKDKFHEVSSIWMMRSMQVNHVDMRYFSFLFQEA